MTIRVTPERFSIVKEAFRKANTKLPIPTKVVIEEGEEEVKKFIASGIKVKIVAIGSTGAEEAKAAKEAKKAEQAAAAAGAEGAAKEGDAKAGDKKDAKAAAPAKADDKKAKK